MIDERIKYLFNSYCNKTASTEERVEFFNWIADPINRSDAQQLMSYLYDNEILKEQSGVKEFDREAMWKHISAYRKDDVLLDRKRKKVKAIRLWSSVAAALAVFFIACWWMVARNIDKEDIADNRAEIYDVPAGGYKAILTLANGQKVLLDTLTKGKSIYDGQLKITKANDGRLVYTYLTAGNGSQDRYNTVETPIGGTYQVTLPDGSQVWLNALSSLHYPIAFDGKERIVELKGEAYFEVAKNKQKPFVVHVNGIAVKVLGTHFNVNAYAVDKVIKTTVLEGAVAVGDVKEALLPTQQLEYYADKTSKLLKGVDTEEVTGWKSGFFTTSSIDMESLMDEVSRWYGVKIEYVEPLHMEFVMKLSREISLRELLTLLELTNEVKFELNHKTLKIMKNKRT